MNEPKLGARSSSFGHGLLAFLFPVSVFAQPAPSSEAAQPPEAARSADAAPATAKPVARDRPVVPGADAPVAPPNERAIDARTAVALALRQNPSLRGADLDVERAKQGVLAEEGRYAFVFQADAGYSSSNVPRLTTDDRVVSTPTRSYQAGTGLRRTFASGGTVEARVEGERFEIERATIAGVAGSQGAQASGGYGASGRVSMSQPLLRGAGTDVGELDLRRARVNREAAEKARSRVASQLARDVLIAYWEAWYAEEALRIERAALELARTQETDAKTRVAQGSLSPADALSFSTRVAELEESVAQAEANSESRAIELRRLTGADRRDAPLVVASAPPELLRTPSRAELEASLEDDSVELAELEAQLRERRLSAEVAGDSQRARLDVEGYVETAGVSDELPMAFQRASQGKWLSAGVSLKFELPLDDTRRRAERTMALLAASSAEEALREGRQRVAAGAALGVANETAARRSLELARKTLEITRQSRAAEEERYRLGLSIAVQVQQAGDDVRRAELRQARSKVNLVLEQTRLLHYAGRLLDEYSL